MLRWTYPIGITLVAALVAWWLSRRRYRIPEDTVHRTLPAWLLPVLAAVGAVVAAPFFLGRPPVVIITYGAALVWGLVLAFIDLDVRRLPDWLTLPAYPVVAVLLALCSAATGDQAALLRAAACAGLAVVAFFLAALFSPGGERPGAGRREAGRDARGAARLAGVVDGALRAADRIHPGRSGGRGAAGQPPGRPPVASVLRSGADRRGLPLGRAAARSEQPVEGPTATWVLGPNLLGTT